MSELGVADPGAAVDLWVASVSTAADVIDTVVETTGVSSGEGMKTSSPLILGD